MFGERASDQRFAFVVSLIGWVACAGIGCHREETGTTHTSSAAASGAPAVSTKGAPAIPDADIARAADRMLKEDRTLRALPVHVTVNSGIAALSGTVPSLLAKDRAVAVAGTLKGVRSVVDNVTVSPVSRTDAQIKADLLGELRRDPAERAYPVDVAVKNGVVTLSGTTDSGPARKMIEDAAKGIPGVVRVDDDVTVHYAMIRPQTEIVADVKSRLANDVWLDGQSITADVKDGAVRLHGTVASVAQRDRAASDAWVAGVNTVDTSGMTVDWWASNDQRHVIDYAVRSDADIASAIRDAFRHDPRLRVLQPAVAVNLGQVVLTGNVETARARAAAEEDARNTVGVWQVRDEVTVPPAGKPTDADIERAARRALSDDLLMKDTTGIRVSSTKGKVVLEGTADSPFQRWDAVVDVASLPGVAEVVDKLGVKQTATEIKANVEDRLFWDPMVERERVTVAVAPDGVATLTGTVDAWSEIRAATTDARIGGATRVVNLLTLKNHPEVTAPDEARH